MNNSNTSSPDDWENDDWETPIFQDKVKPFPGRDPHGEMFWPNYQDRRRKRLAQNQLQSLGNKVIPFVRPMSFLGLTLWVLQQPFLVPPREIAAMSQIIGLPNAVWNGDVPDNSQNPQSFWIQKISPWAIERSSSKNSWETSLGSINLSESQLVETVLLVDHVAKTPSLWTKPDLYLDATDPGTLYCFNKNI
jgi:hypothetical protein